MPGSEGLPEMATGQAILVEELEKGKVPGRHEGRPLNAPGPPTIGVTFLCALESFAGLSETLIEEMAWMTWVVVLEWTEKEHSKSSHKDTKVSVF